MEGLTQEALDLRPREGEGDLAINSLVVKVAHPAVSETFWLKSMLEAAAKKFQLWRSALKRLVVSVMERNHEGFLV